MAGTRKEAVSVGRKVASSRVCCVVGVWKTSEELSRNSREKSRLGIGVWECAIQPEHFRGHHSERTWAAQVLSDKGRQGSNKWYWRRRQPGRWEENLPSDHVWVETKDKTNGLFCVFTRQNILLPHWINKLSSTTQAYIN